MQRSANLDTLQDCNAPEQNAHQQNQYVIHARNQVKKSCVDSLNSMCMRRVYADRHDKCGQYQQFKMDIHFCSLNFIHRLLGLNDAITDQSQINPSGLRLWLGLCKELLSIWINLELLKGYYGDDSIAIKLFYYLERFPQICGSSQSF